LKKVLLLSLFTFYNVQCVAQMTSVNIEKVRELYQKAPMEEKVCKRLIKMLQPYNEQNNALLQGYKASATMMMARHTWNPFSKLARFRDGKRMLAKAVEADTQNAELRFLRLAVQLKTPPFLGYRDYVNADKHFLRQVLPKLKNLSLKKFIVKQLKNLNLFKEIDLLQSIKSS